MGWVSQGRAGRKSEFYTGSGGRDSVPVVRVFEHLGSSLLLIGTIGFVRSSRFCRGTMLRAVSCRLAAGEIEFFQALRAVSSGQITGLRVDADRHDRFRLCEVLRRCSGQGLAHEALPDRGGDRTAGKAFTPRLWGVMPDPDAGDQLRCVADEPGIPVGIGGAGLAGRRPAACGW